LVPLDSIATSPWHQVQQFSIGECLELRSDTVVRQPKVVFEVRGTDQAVFGAGHRYDDIKPIKIPKDQLRTAT
jgi:hypothetical protein